MAAPEPGAPAPAPAPEAPTTTTGEGASKDESLLDAVKEFDRHRLELSALIGREVGGDLSRDLDEARPAEPAAPSAGAAPPTDAAPRTRAAEKATRAEAEESKAKPLKKGDDGCVNVCRALDSLTRSAAAVCRLDGGAERCRRANAVVSVAQEEPGVRACACKR
jgi:hypothetical protein